MIHNTKYEFPDMVDITHAFTLDTAIDNSSDISLPPFYYIVNLCNAAEY